MAPRSRCIPPSSCCEAWQWMYYWNSQIVIPVFMWKVYTQTFFPGSNLFRRGIPPRPHVGPAAHLAGWMGTGLRVHTPRPAPHHVWSTSRTAETGDSYKVSSCMCPGDLVGLFRSLVQVRSLDYSFVPDGLMAFWPKGVKFVKYFVFLKVIIN